MEKKPNRLISEKSPYLLQHAYNPVDWYPWSQEAFEKARLENRPIFLSIGYATCYWCHVMERECFENTEVAKKLNDSFICIKVDREESPYIDKMYMDFATTLMSSGGGWPLNLFLTPELKPFFACTYLPAEPKEGLMGILQLIDHINTVWHSDQRDQLFDQAEQVVALLQSIAEPTGNKLPSDGDVEEIFSAIFELVDPIFGGFQGAPKFPIASLFFSLFVFSKLRQDTRAAFFVDLSLEKMALGGIYDHVGGGFARYAVDPKWQVPHFEKMLYDNALLVEAYLYGWKTFKKERFKEVVNETLQYIEREMTSKEGAFFSAQDAESEGEEGRYYTFTIHELQQTLSSELFDLVCSYYQITPEGNFHGKIVLATEEPLEKFCQGRGIKHEAIKMKLKEAREQLFAFRQKREAPLKDDKIIAGWNGLMIHTMALAGFSFQNEDFCKRASEAANFVMGSLYQNQTLHRRYREKEICHFGILDDYAFMIRALITLYECDLGLHYIDQAIELTEIIEQRFRAESGGYYYAEKEEELFFRKCDFYDGSEPSGNSVHLENLLRLFQITKESRYRDRAEGILKAICEKIHFFTPSNTYLACGIMQYLNPKAASVVIALSEEMDAKEEIQSFLANRYLPHVTISWHRVKDPIRWDLEGKSSLEGKTTLYLCFRDRCLEPAVGKEAILKLLKEKLC